LYSEQTDTRADEASEISYAWLLLARSGMEKFRPTGH
jgi:hypothetical protein